VEKKQYDLCAEVLRRLDGEGILEKTVLVGSTISIRFQDLLVTVPHPANFALHKLIVSLRSSFSTILRKWQRKIGQVLAELGEEDILVVLES